MCTLACAHQFHDTCVIKWLAQSALCPLCKSHALGEPCESSTSGAHEPIDLETPSSPQSSRPVSPTVAPSPSVDLSLDVVEPPPRPHITPPSRVLTADGIAPSYYRQQAEIMQAAPPVQPATRAVRRSDGGAEIASGGAEIASSSRPHYARPLVGSSAAGARRRRFVEIKAPPLPPPAAAPRPLRQLQPPREAAQRLPRRPESREAERGAERSRSPALAQPGRSGGVVHHQHQFDLGPATPPTHPKQRSGQENGSGGTPSRDVAHQRRRPVAAAIQLPLAVNGNAVPVASSTARGVALPTASAAVRTSAIGRRR